jgi:tetratricopeptide (TPR) repeat protein
MRRGLGIVRVIRCPTCYRFVALDSACPHDGTPLQTRAEDERAGLEPPHVAGITVLSPLGAGGQAVVWAARRDADGAASALKVARDSDLLLKERFRFEVSALARVGAPHVPALYGAGELEDGRPYIAMERLGGETLAARLAARSTPLGAADTMRVGEAVLTALAAVHQAGILHRDLKPENVILVDGRAVLVDFGVSRSEVRDDGEQLTRVGVAVGTPEYMAPEQLGGAAEIDARTDLYAFGVLLYEMLTLRPPFTGVRHDVERGHLTLRPPRPRTFAAVSPALEELVLACLAKVPSRRPASCAALLRSIHEARAAYEETPSAVHEVVGAARPELFADGRESAVVIVIERAGSAKRVLAALAAHRGFIARQRGSRYTGVFSSVDTPDPAHAALAAARAIAEDRGARVALHLAPLVVRARHTGAHAAFGGAVDRPETWLPREPWSGVWISEALGSLLPSEEVSRQRSRSGEALRSDFEPTLFGRDPEIEALAAHARAVLDDEGSGPGLFTIVGAPGLGKSSLAEAAARLALALRPGVQGLLLRASPTRMDSVAAETAELHAFARPGRRMPTSSQDAMLAIANGLRERAERAPVAIVVDDAHWAEDVVLDALEQATALGATLPLWVVVAVTPPFAQARPSWGVRAHRHAQRTLAPLAPRDAMTLAAHLLQPAEAPPTDVLARLATWAAGSPAALVELALALKQAGVIRQHKRGRGFYVSTAALDKLPRSPAWQWLAAHQLEAMPPDLASFARLCAALGDDVSRDEIAGVQDALDRAGGAGVALDAGYGLAALAERGLLVPLANHRYRFESALLRDAIHQQLHGEQRAQVHRVALSWYQERLDPATPSIEHLAAIARHASACGEHREAAAAHLRLGERAHARHRHLDVDQHLTAALAHLDDADLRRRAEAHMIRGRSRYHLVRQDEAEADLQAARAHAVRLGDRALEAAVLLELATALDWGWKFQESARHEEEAAALVEASGAHHLRARVLAARGRTLYRRCVELSAGQVAPCIEIFEEAIATAIALDDYEARVISLLMLGGALSGAGRFDEAERRFDEVIALTSLAEDWGHLAAAYNNRICHFTARARPERAWEDFRRLREVVRSTGTVTLEVVALGNTAEALFLNGWLERALALARQGMVAEEREGAFWMSHLVVARALLMRGDCAQAARHARALLAAREPELGASRFLLLDLVLRVAADLEPEGPPARLGWSELLARADEDHGLMREERLEILYWRVRCALAAGDHHEATVVRARAHPILSTCPVWRPRFAELDAAMEEPLSRLVG